jgi:hypothetical protein
MIYNSDTFRQFVRVEKSKEKSMQNFAFLYRKGPVKKVGVSKSGKEVSGRAENSQLGVTFCALSDGIFSFQSQRFSATSLGVDLMDALLRSILWVYGHTYQSADLSVNCTRTVSDPLGFVGENCGFRPSIRITLYDNASVTVTGAVHSRS